MDAFELSHEPVTSNDFIVRSQPMLPMEIWYLIVEAVDDPRTLLALACICRALNVWATKTFTRYDSYILHILNGQEDLRVLCHSLRQIPMLPFFLRYIVLEDALLPSFALKLISLCPNLQELVIRPSPTVRPSNVSLRVVVRYALMQFRSVVRLHLMATMFASPMEFVRIVCAFPQLLHLTLGDVRSATGVVHTLLPPFVRLLGLRTLHVQVSDDISLYQYLLSAPALSSSLNSITMHLDSSLLHRPGTGKFVDSHHNRLPKLSPSFFSTVSPVIQESFTHLDSLRELIFYSTVDEESAVSVLELSEILVVIPPSIPIQSLTIILEHMDPSSQLSNEQCQAWQRCFTSLSRALHSVQLPHLSVISIILIGLPVSDIGRFLCSAFKDLLSRRLLNIIVSETADSSMPHQFQWRGTMTAEYPLTLLPSSLGMWMTRPAEILASVQLQAHPIEPISHPDPILSTSPRRAPAKSARSEIRSNLT
ncbi:hypothetical protein CERSUDRAFT_119195 [Gelatoporia subvermispora B]|uniref:F-box domain-containing protein n=1 Tax=Ceriporiopsis subvermispora (strain B) TaxID=914234 RepID=M2QZC5_CERS8|nr:hypothetical protein CERSUDRAFT_119195 [Gelatoporia subvermispora B]